MLKTFQTQEVLVTLMTHSQTLSPSRKLCKFPVDFRSQRVLDTVS